MRVIGTYAALAAASAFLAWLYVGTERCVYYWDFVNFQNRAYFLTELALTRPLSAAAAVVRSLHHDYTYLPCVPLLPFLAVLGRSRMTYVTALALTYLAPFCVLCGTIAGRVNRHAQRACFWTAALMSLLTPAACVVVFRGYPDLGAATLVGCAFLLHLRDPGLRRQSTGYAAGALLALAALFRRPFIYSGAAFAGAALTETALTAIQGLCARRPAITARAVQRGRGIGRLCISFAVLSTPLLVSAFCSGYGELYRSYRQGAGAALAFFGHSFGWLPAVLSAAGLAWAAAHRGVSGLGARRLALFTCIFLVLWVSSARFTGIHYTAPLVMPLTLGLLLLIAPAWRMQQSSARLACAAALGIVVAANALAALTPLGTRPWPLHALLASANPPLVRDDLPELTRLVAFLRDSAAGQPIYVAASSETLNESILREAERQRYGRTNVRLQVLSGSDVDSRDPSPLVGLAEARWVVIAEPFQHVLRPEEQDVVRYVVDSFGEGWGVAEDFLRVPAAFGLQGGVHVSVFRRCRQTSSETLRAAADSLAVRVDAVRD